MWILFIHDLSFTLWSLYLFLIGTDNLSHCSIRFGLTHWLSAADETYWRRFSLSFHVTLWSLAHKPLRKHSFSLALTLYPDHEWNSSNSSVQIRRAPSVWVCVNLKIIKIAVCSIFITAWIKHMKYWGAAGRKGGVLALTAPRKCLLSSQMILGLLCLTEINTQQRGADDAQPWRDVVEHFNLWWTYFQNCATCLSRMFKIAENAPSFDNISLCVATLR